MRLKIHCFILFYGWVIAHCIYVLHLLYWHWIARRSNQSILKEINLEYSLGGQRLKLQHLGQLMWRANSLGKTLMLGKIKGRRRRGWQRMRWLDSITDSMDISLSNSRRQWRTGKSGVLQSMGLERVRLRDWTRTTTSLSTPLSMDMTLLLKWKYIKK